MLRKLNDWIIDAFTVERYTQVLDALVSDLWAWRGLISLVLILLVMILCIVAVVTNAAH